MNRKLILRLLGAILSIEALAMIPSFLIALRFGDGDALLLGLCALALLIPGLLLWFTVHPQSGSHLRLIEGFIIVAVGWVALSLGGALPFFFSDRYASFEDALFEAVSGFTTTGATVTVDYEGFPRGLMFWRATTHWIGGMGVLVLTLALAGAAPPSHGPHFPSGPRGKPGAVPEQAGPSHRNHGQTSLQNLHCSDSSGIPRAAALRAESL